MFRSLSVATLALLGMAALAGGEPPSWPSLHNGGDTSTDLKRLPLTWSPDEGIGWSLELPGYGQSAPVVWGERVYVTAVDGDDKETCFVIACDLSTGQVVWTHRFPATVRTPISYMVSRAAPTPVVDRHGVYAMFESGDFHALNHGGELRWATALFDGEERRFRNAHGYGASPAQTADAVVVVVDHRGPSYLAAFSKATGRQLWRTERHSRSSWTSPRATQIGDTEQIIVSSDGTVDGYDAATGTLLWSHTGLSGNLIPSVTVQGDRVFTGADVGNRDKDADSAASSNRCLQISPASAEGYKVLWKANKVLSHYASPLAHRGCVYYVNRVGVLYCLDADTGDEIYVKRTSGPCWAQPIAAQDHIYLFHKDGLTTVIQAGRAFEIVAENRLWPEDQPPLPKRTFEFDPPKEDDPRPRQPAPHYMDPLVYGVAAVEGAFIVRVGTHLYRIGTVASDGSP